MNKEAKTKLEKIQIQLMSLQEELEMIASDEQYKFDNLPEGLQQAERGQIMEQAASDLDEAKDYVQEAVDSLQNAIDKIEEATTA